MFHIYIITIFPYLKHCLRPAGGVFCSNIYCDMVLVDAIHCSEIWSTSSMLFPTLHNTQLDFNTILSS